VRIRDVGSDGAIVGGELVSALSAKRE